MSVTSSDPFYAVSSVPTRVRRLGERTCIVDPGTELRHVDLAAVEESVRALVGDGGQDLVFDLTHLRRYETFALVRLAREWDRLSAAGCTVMVAARDPRVTADLERLVGAVGWSLHPSATAALRALLSAPVA